VLHVVGTSVHPQARYWCSRRGHWAGGGAYAGGAYTSHPGAEQSGQSSAQQVGRAQQSCAQYPVDTAQYGRHGSVTETSAVTATNSVQTTAAECARSESAATATVSDTATVSVISITQTE